jgi:hypothetical protein
MVPPVPATRAPSISGTPRVRGTCQAWRRATAGSSARSGSTTPLARSRRAPPERGVDSRPTRRSRPAAGQMCRPRRPARPLRWRAECLIARRMLAVAAQLGFGRCLFAVFAAVLAVRAAFRDETLTGRMRAFVGICHRCSPQFLWAFSSGRSTRRRVQSVRLISRTTVSSTAQRPGFGSAIVDGRSISPRSTTCIDC